MWRRAYHGCLRRSLLIGRPRVLESVAKHPFLGRVHLRDKGDRRTRSVIRYESIDDVTGLACPGTDPEGCVNVKYGIMLNHEKREGTFICAACHLRSSSRPRISRAARLAQLPRRHPGRLRTVVASAWPQGRGCSARERRTALLALVRSRGAYGRGA